MERDEMPCDVLFVGAGPANLAGAIHLMDLIEAHNAAIGSGEADGEVLDEPMIVVLEKGSGVGQHQLSGAVLDPIALDELIPDWRGRGCPVERFVEREEMVLLTPESAVPAPWIPPELDNHGKPIISLGRFCRWLGEIAEEKGVNVLSGFTGQELLWDGEAVVGVRTGDKGIGKDGQPKDQFEPGMDLQTPITILGEGPRGHLTRKLIQRRGLDRDSEPMIYYVGVKEVLEMPAGSVEDGWVMHSVGYPLDVHTFGGSFAYSMGGDKVCIGLLVGLDAADPQMDAHHLLQLLKMHPHVRSKLGAGKVIKYGAKAVTIGGWASVPQLSTDGAMIVGDSASFLNPLRIKGIHLSMKSGMLAAEAAFEAMLRGEATAQALSSYPQKVQDSWIVSDMEPGRNMHANFKDHFVSGMVQTALQYAFGPGPQKRYSPDYTHIERKASYQPAPWTTQEVPYDGVYLVDKLTDVYNSGTQHEEQQPAHLKIVDTEVCATTCREEYGNPCTRFCPAQVYNMRESEQSGRLEMEIDFANCVHCKTCDIRDPYQIITWMPPEAGEGPEYDLM
ncbi:MAG TPA: electron transfer flavoprotein-ubiquinone oxidoreductase [Deltaproteobacteria bacterium]|nr:electron transfer flavoprotein-ubiquinone oxidoreductase [Deltaproteobacteria bacterium]